MNESIEAMIKFTFVGIIVALAGYGYFKLFSWNPVWVLLGTFILCLNYKD